MKRNCLSKVIAMAMALVLCTVLIVPAAAQNGIELPLVCLTHSPEEIPAVAASCTQTGLTAGSKCSVCGEILTAQQEIPAFGHSYEDGVCITCGENEPVSLKISSAYLQLDEDIDVIYAASVPADCTDPYMVFTFQGCDIEVTNYTEDDGKLLFELSRVVPQCMGDNISATLYAKKGGETVSYTKANYSVRTYCENQLAKSDDAKLTTLLSDLLTYGAAAQTYTGYRTDALVTSGLELTPSAFTALETKKATFTGEMSDSVDWTAATLVLSNAPAIRFYFVAETVDGLTVTASLNGREQTFTTFTEAGEDKYYIEFRGVTATEFDDAVTASFSVGGTATGRTVSYSINTYIYGMQNSDNTILQALVRALYNYGASAAAYAG